VRGGGDSSHKINLVIEQRRRWQMEMIKCPNPKCKRRILDDEGTETEWTVLEIKCRHCGKLVRLHCGPDGIEAVICEKKKRRR